MLPLFLSLALAAAPIPKGVTYEGCIALQITAPEPQVLILSPSGEELKRISLKDIEGTIETIRIGRDRTCLLVQSSLGKNNLSDQIPQSLYWIDLNEKSKPKRIIRRENPFAWVVNRESTTIYASELIPSPKADAKVLNPQIHWQCDVKTGKPEKIDLPEDYYFVDICHADNTILVSVLSPKKAPSDYQFLTLSSKDWKPTFQSPKDFWARLISPDGKSVVCYELKTLPNGQRVFRDLAIFNVKTKAKIDYPKSDPSESILSYTIGTNNRVASVVQAYNQLNPNTVSHDVYVMSYDGMTKKKIYTNKPGEHIRDCDWR